MKKLSLLFGVLLMTSCTTFSLTNVMVDGQASDVVDGQQTQDPDPTLDVSLPVAP